MASTEPGFRHVGESRDDLVPEDSQEWPAARNRLLRRRVPQRIRADPAHGRPSPPKGQSTLRIRVSFGTSARALDYLAPETACDRLCLSLAASAGTADARGPIDYCVPDFSIFTEIPEGATDD